MFDIIVTETAQASSFDDHKQDACATVNNTYAGGKTPSARQTICSVPSERESRCGPKTQGAALG